MRRRSGIVGALFAALLLLAGISQASASEETTLEWNTGALADFGFGVTDYHADTTVPARVHVTQHNERITAYLPGVVYTKVGGPAESPESFTIIDGEFTGQGIRPPLPDKGHGRAAWRFTIETPDGTTYKCRGLILDFNRTEDRDVQHHVGPVIEP